MSDSFATPMDYSLPSSSVHGISQARILEWVAISFSRDCPDPEIQFVSPALKANSLPLSHLGSPEMRILKIMSSCCPQGAVGNIYKPIITVQ